MVCWNFSSRFLDSQQGYLVHEWFPKIVFSRGSRTTAERGWSQFTGHCRVHSQDRDLFASYRTYRWATFLPGPLAVLDLTTPKRTLLSMDGCQIVVGGRIQTRDALFGHLSDVLTPLNTKVAIKCLWRYNLWATIGELEADEGKLRGWYYLELLMSPEKNLVCRRLPERQPWKINIGHQAWPWAI